ncbi:unnamed protein product [Clonostachys rosea f. rosea IK726]|uniref:Uncharacterized protein n=1 Tax=Clonostachys rosea f. rosea IK726 TaxID=1349383 RepID=A0ACA9UCB6_BIOOC|nr:unnamed protein product [Clonostachys rosea f. rosea IK726]
MAYSNRSTSLLIAEAICLLFVSSAIATRLYVKLLILKTHTIDDHFMYLTFPEEVSAKQWMNWNLIKWKLAFTSGTFVN